MAEPNRLREQVAPNTIAPHAGVARQWTPNSGGPLIGSPAAIAQALTAPATPALNAFAAARTATLLRTRSSTLGTILIGAIGELMVLFAVGIVTPTADSPGFGPTVIVGEVLLGIVLGLRTEGLRGYLVAWAGMFVGAAIAGSFVALPYLKQSSDGTPGGLAGAFGVWLGTTLIVGFVAALFVMFGVYIGHAPSRRRAREAKAAMGAAAPFA